MNKIAFLLLTVALVLSCGSYRSVKNDIIFINSNSRDTYFSMHNIKPVHKISSGQGIKIGILDHYFGVQIHKDLYSGSIDFINKPNKLKTISEHGYWMANVLKEIAPDCEIYALNVMSFNMQKRVDAIDSAIDWAIKNDIDILTYSGSRIPKEFVNSLNHSLKRAHRSGIVTTFINIDNKTNILPNIFGNYYKEDGREPDINIFSYDYNTLLLSTYDSYIKNQKRVTGGENTPYFSYSSTSPVTAGLIALLMEKKTNLEIVEYKNILTESSYSFSYFDPFYKKEFNIKRAADIQNAFLYMEKNY